MRAKPRRMRLKDQLLLALLPEARQSIDQRQEPSPNAHGQNAAQHAANGQSVRLRAGGNDTEGTSRPGKSSFLRPSRFRNHLRHRTRILPRDPRAGFATLRRILWRRRGDYLTAGGRTTTLPLNLRSPDSQRAATLRRLNGSDRKTSFYLNCQKASVPFLF
jgi:hypothetical protein